MPAANTATRALLKVEALAGNDNDLPASDRRGRPNQVVEGRSLREGDALNVIGGLQVAVVCAARGRTRFVGGWTSTEPSVSAPHMGVFSVDQIDP